MAREAEFEREVAQVRFAVRDAPEGRTQPQAMPVLMDRDARFATKEPREVKGRRVHRAPHLVERRVIAEGAREEQTRLVDELGVRVPVLVRAGVATKPRVR